MHKGEILLFLPKKKASRLCTGGSLFSSDEHLADLCEADYRNLMGVTREEFGRMLQALEEGYRREHKRKPRFTKITMVDKLILTLTYRCQYRSMDSIAKEYEVSLDTISDNIHWVEQTLLNADLLESSVTCVYKTNAGTTAH